MKLIETIRWDRKGYFLLKLHLERLEASARELGFKLDLDKIRKELKALGKRLKQNKIYMVRLLLSKNGSIKIEKKIKPEIKNRLVVFSRKHTSSSNRFLLHKSTKRSLYDSELKKAREQGLRDVIFFNEKGEVTEACVANVFVKAKGSFYTPPLRCGLLPGVLREHLLRSKRIKIKERVLKKEDLMKADKIYLANSVSGLFEVKLKRRR